MSDITLKLTSAVAIDGNIHRPGSTIDVAPRLARELLARGKAEVAEPEADTAPLDDLDEATDDQLRDLAKEYALKLPRRFDRATWIKAIRATAEGE